MSKSNTKELLHINWRQVGTVYQQYLAVSVETSVLVAASDDSGCFHRSALLNQENPAPLPALAMVSSRTELSRR